jgi:hypothetical protein
VLKKTSLSLQDAKNVHDKFNHAVNGLIQSSHEVSGKLRWEVLLEKISDEAIDFADRETMDLIAHLERKMPADIYGERKLKPRRLGSDVVLTQEGLIDEVAKKADLSIQCPPDRKLLAQVQREIKSGIGFLPVSAAGRNPAP